MVKRTYYSPKVAVPAVGMTGATMGGSNQTAATDV